MPSKGGPNIITDGLVFAVDAADANSYPGSGTTWKDWSGNGNDGTLVNGPTFDGESIVFDGTNDYADFGTSSNTLITSTLSIESWFKLNTNYSGNWRIIAGRAETTKETYDLRVSAIYNTIVFLFRDNAGYYQANTGVQTIGEWLHVVGTFNGDTKEGKVYLNSTLKDTILSVNPTLNNTSNFFTIGGRYSSSQWRDFINADIPLVRVYNRALSASEITQNYNALKSRFNL